MNAVLQAVALVFDHVLVEMHQSSSSMAVEPASPIGASDSGSAKGPDTPTARGHGTTNAAVKLLDDLCMMATGDMLLCLWYCYILVLLVGEVALSYLMRTSYWGCLLGIFHWGRCMGMSHWGWLRWRGALEGKSIAW